MNDLGFFFESFTLSDSTEALSPDWIASGNAQLGLEGGEGHLLETRQIQELMCCLYGENLHWVDGYMAFNHWEECFNRTLLEANGSKHLAIVNDTSAYTLEGNAVGTHWWVVCWVIEESTTTGAPCEKQTQTQTKAPGAENGDPQEHQRPRGAAKRSEPENAGAATAEHRKVKRQQSRGPTTLFDLPAFKQRQANQTVLELEAERNRMAVHALQLPSVHAPTSLPLPPWLAEANRCGLKLWTLIVDFWQPCTASVEIGVWLQTLFPSQDERIFVDRSKQQIGQSCGYVSGCVLADLKRLGDRWLDGRGRLGHAVEPIWIKEGNRLLKEHYASVAAAARRQCTCHGKRMGSMPLSLDHYLTGTEALLLAHAWSCGSGISGNVACVSTNTWASAYSLDYFVRCIAEDVANFLSDASRRRGPIFCLVNNRDSTSAGEHWFSVVYDLRWDGTEEDRALAARMV